MSEPKAQNQAGKADGGAPGEGSNPSEEISRVLFDAWVRVPSPALASTVARQVRVPGDVALRGRFHVVTDPMPPRWPSAGFRITWALWQRQVTLTRWLDDALVGNDRVSAEEAAERLTSSAKPDHFPLPRIDALIGRGDAARQADDLEAAIKHLTEAASEAAQCGYRFGEARALVSLGYVTMQIRSMGDAAMAFERAAGICRALDERMYLANALIGLGEAHSRLRRHDEAVEALEAGLRWSEQISSRGGAMNASQHLGDLYRRRRDPDAALPYFARALELAEETSTAIAVVNAADGLGEVWLAKGDVERAEGFYQRALAAADAMPYRRGRAHARNGLGRAAFHREDFQEAIDSHVEAYETFVELGDLASATSALDGMARVAAALGERDLAATCRLAAVDSIEQMRAAQDRHDGQVEYLERFDAVYGNALRAALVAEQPHAFVASFEGLAGRRLAGLVSSLPDDLTSNANLLAELTMRAHRRDPPTEGSRPRRLAQLLGTIALQGALPDHADRAIDDLVAALYQPFDPATGSDLLKRVAAITDVLLVCQIPDDPGVIAWLRTTDHGQHVSIGSHGLTEVTVRLVADLAGDGLSADATTATVEPLRDLLPAPALAPSDDAVLTIVPLGALWAVPWPAIPLQNSMLGTRAALAVSPSLTIADHAKDKKRRPVATIGHWRSPLIRYHQLQALGTDDTRVSTETLPTADATLEALLDGRHDVLIIAGHGRPAPGIGHYLELDRDVALEPTGLLAATPPDVLVLLACWGANRPGQRQGDPLTLATLALARGSHHVVATTSELRDDRLASRFVNNVLHQIPDESLPQAIRRETARFLSSSSGREGPLSRWAPLITIGVAKRDHP